MALSSPQGPGPEGTPERVAVRFRLDQFLKWQGLVATGGEAKLWVQQGEVKVNGEVEERRGRQLRPGDLVEIRGQAVAVPGP
ncbi:RNA-binding S4 domain-containing protein [Cyanobium sp. Morenito 9A2]|uniref:RNA-binding S4 domain-containing protein n=1 Tax=Cyanobium sp. Morenito 9A2 TaxID=2823718 RepID=UPI0020CDDEC0|nr:RNA-binding S4 domain-containing protein [Cyanobium sp. Morenito 9A2]MCP9851194.1 RNA-binding S4 domain-containing protein [Cyanobium sp. Morenito 9A2]